LPKYSPTTISWTPSPSKSPIFDTADPNLSPPNSFPFPNLLSFILKESLTLPFVFRNSIQTAPLLVPPSSFKNSPTARSWIPSLSKSPMLATLIPNLSELNSFPFPNLLSFILYESFTLPFVFKNKIQTAPLLVPPSSLKSSPTARSWIPSPSKSPMLATDCPKKSPLNSLPLPNLLTFILKESLTLPFVFRNSIQTAPLLDPPSSFLGSPTARSWIPSPSRSPMLATLAPNSSPLNSLPLPNLLTFILKESFTLLLVFKNKIQTAPLLSPPSSFKNSPTAIS